MGQNPPLAGLGKTLRPTRLRKTPHTSAPNLGLSCGPMKDTQPMDIKSPNRDKLEGTAKIVSGKVKAGIGKALGNPVLAAKGDSETLVGHIQKKAGEIKQALFN
jgi:uncharacterized protein YjbJ (UPF0337 family)